MYVKYMFCAIELTLVRSPKSQIIICPFLIKFLYST